MKLTYHLTRYLWRLFAGIVIVLAVAVSLARVLLPYLDEYRSALEARVSLYLEQPVTIERLDARLLGINPSIIFRHVALHSADGKIPLARFEEIRIGLDLFATLRQWRPVLRELTVAGANMVVVRRPDGSFSVEGLGAAQREPGAAAPEAALGPVGSLGEWLFGQGRLAVRDSNVVWRDETRHRLWRFAQVDLELVNSGNRHRLNASLTLPEGTGKALRFAADIRGNPLLGPDWDGSFYVKAEALRPASWLPLVSERLPEIPLKSGQVSGELWSEWRQGGLVGTEGRFEIGDAVLQAAGNPAAAIKHLSGELRWQLQQEGWVLDIRQLKLRTAGEETPAACLQLSHRADRDLLQADRLPLQEMATVVARLPLLPESALALLRGLSPRGEVRQLRIERYADGRLSSQGEFRGLGLTAWESVPGFDGAAGRWRADNAGGEMVLDSRGLRFDAPQLFRAPLQIDTLAAALSFRPLDDGWQVAGRHITAGNGDIAVRGEFDMQVEKGRNPYLDLRFDFWNGVAQRVPRYVPAKIMGEAVLGWLDGAFAAGRVRSGTLLFHGRSGDFPFVGHEGLFETRFEAEDIELAFHPNWPHLSGVSGEVLFENQALTITPRRGRLFSTEIERARVTIGDLMAPVLAVEIGAAPPAGDVLRLLRETPLAEHVGDALRGMEASGNSRLNLALYLPLSAAMEEKSPLRYQGEVALRDARLQVWKGVVFRNLHGGVQFSDSGFESSGLGGELFGAPVAVTIHTDDTRRTLVAGQGRLTAEALQREMQLPFIEHLEGESDWRGLLYLPRGEGTHPSMEFTSTLAGMALNLPAPVGKGRDETLPLAVRVAYGEAAAKRLSLTYGERVSGRFGFVGEEPRLTRAALRFGPGGVELPKQDGWRISGTLEGLDWGGWHDLLPAGSGSDPSVPLVIDMERLTLLPMAEAKSGSPESALAPEKFPSLDLHVRDFVYDQWHLGEVSGSSRSDSTSWAVPDLHLSGPHHDIHLAAHWHAGDKSRFEFNAKSDNVEQMLHSFGLASLITQGKATANGTLSWPGTLSEPSWGVVEGKLAVEIHDGALVDVNPGAGRLFGLLSLQALPRRLTLDFRDLFQKGMQFDEIKGDIRVKAGDALTDNLYIKSPSAGVLVEGRSGLVQRDYDQIVSVVPNVSESVSIASAIAWGPQVAAAVLLLQNVFKKDIAKATMIRYSVKGSWDDPQFARLTPTSAPQAPLAVPE